MMNITLVEDEPMVAKRLARFIDQCTDDKTTIHRFPTSMMQKSICLTATQTCFF